MKIMLAGSSGRLNQSIARLARLSDIAVEFYNPSDHSLIEDIDCFIDFSHAGFWNELKVILKEKKIPLVCGTTGIENIAAEIAKLGEIIPALHAANFSLGIAYLANILSQRPKSLYNTVVEETHHKLKVDAPSGTALDLAKILGLDPSKIISRREGDELGTHTVILNFDDQELVISHKVFSIDVFAKAAIKVATWLHKLPAGCYTLRDYLEEEKNYVS